MSDRRGVGDTGFEVQGRDIQTRGSSACSSLNRCEPSLPNSIPARGAIKGHAQRPDTRPIEDPAEKPKITLAKKGASTHAPPRSVAQTWKLRFAKSIAKMYTSIICLSFDSTTMVLQWHYKMPSEGGIHPISSD